MELSHNHVLTHRGVFTYYLTFTTVVFHSSPTSNRTPTATQAQQRLACHGTLDMVSHGWQHPQYAGASTESNATMSPQSTQDNYAHNALLHMVAEHGTRPRVPVHKRTGDDSRADHQSKYVCKTCVKDQRSVAADDLSSAHSTRACSTRNAQSDRRVSFLFR